MFLAAVDLPLLHPAFVSQMLAALPGFDAAVAVADGRDQPLAAAYDAVVCSSGRRSSWPPARRG